MYKWYHKVFVFLFLTLLVCGGSQLCCPAVIKPRTSVIGSQGGEYDEAGFPLQGTYF